MISIERFRFSITKVYSMLCTSKFLSTLENCAATGRKESSLELHREPKLDAVTLGNLLFCLTFCASVGFKLRAMSAPLGEVVGPANK